MQKYDERLEYSANTQVLIGQQRRMLIDPETNEEVWVDQITKRAYGTKQFWKVYLMDFLTVLGIIDNKQLDVFIYIASNTNAMTNLFIGTYTKISKDVGVSSATIAKIMKKLQENGFVKKVQNGVWFVHPNILMKGSDHKRQILLSYYQSDAPLNEITYRRVKRNEIPTEAELEADGQGVLPMIESGDETNG